MNKDVAEMFTNQYRAMSEIENLSFKFGQIQAIATMLAESISDNTQSSVAWAIADLAKDADDKIYEAYEEVLSNQRLLKEHALELEAKVRKQNAKKSRTKKSS